MKADKSRDVREIVSVIKFGEPKNFENAARINEQT